MLRLPRQSGFSLIEIMVSIALLGGLILAGMEMFNMQSKSTKYNSVRADLDSYHGKLTKVFSDYRNCNANFYPAMTPNTTVNASTMAVNNGLSQCCPSGSSNPDQCVLSSNIDDYECVRRPSNSYNFAGNTKVIVDTIDGFKDKTLKFKPVNFEVRDNTGALGISGTLGENSIKKGVIRIVYKLDDDLKGVKEVVKTIPITLKFNGLNFYSCVDPEISSKNTLNREMCEGIGNRLLTYDTDSDQCNWKSTALTHNCENLGAIQGQVLLGLAGDGQPICAPLADQGTALGIQLANEIEPIDATTCANSTDVTFELVNGKIRVKCVP